MRGLHVLTGSLDHWAVKFSGFVGAAMCPKPVFSKSVEMTSFCDSPKIAKTVMANILDGRNMGILVEITGKITQRASLKPSEDIGIVFMATVKDFQVNLNEG